MIKLKHIVNGTIVNEIDLNEGTFTIGRNHGNDLQLDDGDVSGQHAMLTLTPNEYLPEQLDIILKDLDSTNGTYVNRIAIKEKAVQHGDLIRICSYEYRVYDDASNISTQTEYLAQE